MFTIASYISSMQTALSEINQTELDQLLQIILKAYENNNTIFIMGNGGSAASASHIAADWGKNTVVADKPRLRVLSLTDNVAVITALGNDLGYDNIFAEQLHNLVLKDDVVIGISASGNSENVLRAIRLGNQEGAVTVGLCGFDGGQLKDLADFSIHIPNHSYEQVEDIHMMIGHIIITQLKNYIQEKA